MPLRFPSVQVSPPSLVVIVCAEVSRLAPPLTVNVKSLRSRPLTGSLKVIVIWGTGLLRRLGVTLVMVATGAVVSILTVRGGELADTGLPGSVCTAVKT